MSLHTLTVAELAAVHKARQFSSLELALHSIFPDGRLCQRRYCMRTGNYRSVYEQLHFETFTCADNTRYFWYISYKIINDANTVIEAASKISNPDQATQQLIGECYFLRAFAHFNLVRLFAKPYTVDPQSPGVIIRTSTSEASQKARATVKEVYDAVIADAEKSASLMNVPRGIQFASKEAAWALLSRVNLYKEDNAKVINYANKVIGSGRFSLETAASFPSLFANALAGRETIFCIAFNSIDDYGKFGSIASMLYSDGNSGWGEEFACCMRARTESYGGNNLLSVINLIMIPLGSTVVGPVSRKCLWNLATASPVLMS